MRPLEYRHKNDISARDIIKVVNGCGYNGYSRSIHSTIENGGQTGTRLMPDAEAAVKAKYPGYWETLPGVKPKETHKPNRKNGCQFTVRTTEDFKHRIIEAMKHIGCSSLQDFILMALEIVVKGIEKAASDAGTSKAAKVKTVNKSIAWIKENVNESV